MAKKKKYLLAPKNLIFDSVEDMIQFLSKQPEDILLWREKYVMGTYIGELEVEKKISIKNTKKTFFIKEELPEGPQPANTKTEPSFIQLPVKKLPPPPPQVITDTNVTSCHFDLDPPVKIIFVKGQKVGLCEVHLEVESALLKGEVSLDEL